MRTSPNRLLRLAAAVALVGVLASCSDDKDDKGASSTTSTTTTAGGGDTTTTVDGGSPQVPDPCSVLTAAELEDAFASPFDAGSEGDSDVSSRQCVWNNTDAPPVRTLSLTILVGPGAPAQFAASKAAVTVDEQLPVGDDAYRAGTTVAVLDGTTAYQLSAFFEDGSSATKGLEKLASKVLP